MLFSNAEKYALYPVMKRMVYVTPKNQYKKPDTPSALTRKRHAACLSKTGYPSPL